MSSSARRGTKRQLPSRSTSSEGSAQGGRKRQRGVTPSRVNGALGAREPRPASSRTRMPTKDYGDILRDLQRHSLIDSSLEAYWKHVVDVFDDIDTKEVPWAVLLSVSPDSPNSFEMDQEPPQLTADKLHLEGAVGVNLDAAGASALTHFLTDKICKEEYDEPIQDVLCGYMELPFDMHRISSRTDQRMGMAMFTPILAHQRHVVGYIFTGTDSRCIYAGFGRAWLGIKTNISRSISSILLYEQVRNPRQGHDEPTEPVELVELRKRADEAERSNQMFRHMAESALVGCAIFSPTGEPIWMNDSYSNLTGIPREDFRPGVWQQAILEEDRPTVEGRWNTLASGAPIEPFSFRVRRKRTGREKPGGYEATDYRWLLSNAYVDWEETPDGKKARRVMGWLTDISAQKWGEKLQAQRLQDALDTKKETERFIDMVSHEIRNPLSAIIQTAEGLVTLVGDGAGDLSRKKQAVVDAGKTVLLCAQHQKRIVDDILTLSKLDSNLLTINPERVTPRALAENVIKMLEADLWSGQIKTTITVDPSYESHSITDVLLDDGRVTQILLNLIANAIKFTKDSNNKCINVRLGASRNRPSIYGSDDITYIAPRSMSYYVPKVSHQQAVSTPNDRDVYLIFDIEDTGPGLGAEEMKTLFQRFSQASTKTYRNFGGFGLGLFICRELAELQGGQIGLSSIPGRGTTFTFYVLAQRCDDVVTAGGVTTASTLNGMSTSFSKTSQSIGRKATNGTGSYFPRTLPPNAPATLPTPPTSGNSLTYAPGDAIHTMNLANLEGLHILIVEDNKIAQSVLVQQLRTTLKSCTVSTADHGGEALAFLTLSTSSSSSKDSCTFLPSSSSPSATLPESQREKQSENSVAKRSVDIILMDLEMPVMDGLTCVRRIRELQSQSQSHSKGCGSGSGSIARISKNLKIIAVTANARGERVEEARRGGMDGVLTKPFRVPELVGLMQSVLVGTDTRKPAKEVADRMARPAAESVAGRTPSRRSTRARAKAKAKA